MTQQVNEVLEATNTPSSEVEGIAEKIYNAFPYDGAGVKPLWQPGGNSDMQERARLLARDITTNHDIEKEKAYADGYADGIQVTGAANHNERMRLMAEDIIAIIKKNGAHLGYKNNVIEEIAAKYITSNDDV